MFKGWVLFLLILGYLCLLFVIAYFAERREKLGRSIVSNPYVYSLSLAVYCTSWTFYGSVGKAATSGFSFLTIYLGPTLMAALWAVLLKKLISISKESRITTISDFIGARYGNSVLLSAFVAIIAVVGITPYLGLQIKAIINTLSILSGQSAGMEAAGWYITFILGVFAIIFGARRLDSSERHEGLVFAVAFESIIKLVMFLIVGLYVTYYLFGGFGDIFDRIKQSDYGELLFLGTGTPVNYTEWGSLLFLSMMAIMFLPRQFHVSVVENSDVRHIYKAMWLFPLYLLLINIFVLPVAFGGLLLGGRPEQADTFMLTIPLGQGNMAVALLTFFGGFAAATGMIIVESVALSTMVMNNLVMPAIFRFNKTAGFPAIILNLKRLIILACVFMGYFFAVSIGEFYSLVDIGLKSFEAVTIFAPAIILGLYWKRGNKTGAAAGMAAGFIIWFYTLLMPALMKAGLLQEKGVLSYLVNSVIFNPQELFGVSGLDRWTHSLFWGMLFNVCLYVGLSIFTRQGNDEAKQALFFVDFYTPGSLPLRGIYSLRQIEDILGQYIGRKEARETTEHFLIKHKIHKESISQNDLIKLRNEAERVLSGALGSAIATLIFEEKLTLTEEERGELSQSIKHMTDTLRLSRQELAEANKNLAYLKEFSENIIESAPVGIVTTDSRLCITYWNKQMELMTGIRRQAAHGGVIAEVLPWLAPGVLNDPGQNEKTVQTETQEFFKINISPFKDPSGGFVVIIEDVTDRAKMEEQLLQSSKMATIGRLTAGISHEIGNPLASISSLVQELRALSYETQTDISFTNDSLKIINTHIDRIARIVRSLGDFARISTGEKVLSNIAEVLDRTVNLIRYDKRVKDVNISTDIGEIPPVRINPDKIQQVFFNMILNALDAMPSGGDLRIAMKQEGSEVVISFADSGRGIEETIVDRIFDPFFTSKPVGKGTGLGLSICYGIIREHKGTIKVQSLVGRGTEFIIRLPLQA